MGDIYHSSHDTNFSVSTLVKGHHLLRTSQHQISRLESPSYEGHSLSMLRRVAEALGATLHVGIHREKHRKERAVAERKAKYGSNA